MFPSQETVKELFELFPELTKVFGLAGAQGRSQVSQVYGELARRSLKRRDLTPLLAV